MSTGWCRSWKTPRQRQASRSHTLAALGRQYGDALGYFNRAAEWNPALNWLDLNHGRAAFMASKFSVAIAPLSRYVKAHSGDSGFRGALAMSQFMIRDYRGCLQTLNWVEDQLTSIPQMAYVFAESLVEISKAAEGTRRLEALEAAHPEIADVHRALDKVFAAGGDRQKAVGEFHTALLLNGSDAQAHYDFGKLNVESGDGAAAIPELQAAVRLHPDDAGFHRELALAYGLVARNQEAQKEVNISKKLANSAPAKPPGRHNQRTNH